mmetsp:Transcript_22855/g.52330  ORF Transcript_22855/g.52330 Transcript_22855/m.52330 type:complete len:222 (+) Transcript_22855:274-939(+)
MWEISWRTNFAARSKSNCSAFSLSFCGIAHCKLNTPKRDAWPTTPTVQLPCDLTASGVSAIVINESARRPLDMCCKTSAASTTAVSHRDVCGARRSRATRHGMKKAVMIPCRVFSASEGISCSLWLLSGKTWIHRLFVSRAKLPNLSSCASLKSSNVCPDSLWQLSQSWMRGGGTGSNQASANRSTCLIKNFSPLVLPTANRRVAAEGTSNLKSLPLAGAP